MARKKFPNDVCSSFERLEARQLDREIPTDNLEALMGSYEGDFPSFDMQKIMQDVKEVHPRAQSWVLAKLDGMSNVEIAEDWEVSPSYLTSWFHKYGQDIKEVFAKHLESIYTGMTG